MTLNVGIEELLSIIADERRYNEDCGHEGFDAGCSVCQSKRILQAWREEELVVNRNDYFEQQ